MIEKARPVGSQVEVSLSAIDVHTRVEAVSESPNS